MFVYKNGVYYIDSLQKAVNAQGDDSADNSGNDSEEIYISIPEDKWDEFANDFSVQVYNNKEDYRKNSLIISALLAILGGVATYFISGHALKPLREFSDKIEEVQIQNLADSRIEESKIKELNQLSVSHRGAKPLRRYELLGGISLLSPEYLLSFERCPFHTETPDHYALVSYLIDLSVSQSSALMPLHSNGGYQSP